MLIFQGPVKLEAINKQESNVVILFFFFFLFLGIGMADRWGLASTDTHTVY